jgi:anti-sigma B factor antagonist
MQVPDVRHLRKLAGGVPIVAAPAEIDITTAGQLRAVLLEATVARHPAVVVDMSRTVFCDASGLHTLVRAHKRTVAEGGGLRLVVPAGGAVSCVIHLTRLDRVIPAFQPGRGPGPGSGHGPARSARRLAAPSPEPRS